MAEERKSNWWTRSVPTPDEVIVGELAERGDWVVANIETNSFWPITAQNVSFLGEVCWIIPIMKNHYPAVAVKRREGMDRDSCERLLMRFLSNLAWVQDKGMVVTGFGGGSLPAPMGREKERGLAICDEFDLSYFPEPTDRRAQLALALMREGRGLNHPAYAFLSFFRVLEVAFPNDGRIRKKWVSSAVGSLRNRDARKAVAKLTAEGVVDVGAHLYDSGRCAIAHANKLPVVDPDDPSDYRRLQSELPIIEALAEKAIEDVLGVETRRTVYEKHLYELAGFKKALGADTVDFLTRGEPITDERMVDVPTISVRIRKRDAYTPLTSLAIQEIAQAGTVLQMRFASKDGSVSINFDLDFEAERLGFSLFNDIVVRDDGSVEAAENLAEMNRFSKEYLGNGQLHIVDAETGELLSRKDAYIPVNMYLDHESADAAISRWKVLAAARRDLNQHYGTEMNRFSTPYHISVRFV